MGSDDLGVGNSLRMAMNLPAAKWVKPFVAHPGQGYRGSWTVPRRWLPGAFHQRELEGRLILKVCDPEAIKAS